MNRKVRIGIIGTGTIANRTHIPFYKNNTDEAEIVAICDVNEKQMSETSDKYSLENVEKYTDFRELIKRDDIDAVDICLHNNFHAPIAIEAMRQGKHVYCEKPLAGTYVDGKSMIDVSKEENRNLHIQLSHIYHESTKIAKKFNDDGILGEVYHVRSVGQRRRGRPYVDGYATPEFVNSYYSGGGAFFDMGVYHISQLIYILGMPKLESVFGNTYQKTDMYTHRKEISGYNVEEMGTGYAKFENRLSMDIIETWAGHMNSVDGSTIYGSKAGIRLEPFGFFTTINDVEMDCTPDNNSWAFRQKKCFDGYYDYSGSMEHWVSTLQGRCKLLPTADIALQTMLIQEGIYFSSQRGSSIDANEIISLSKSKAIKI